MQLYFIRHAQSANNRLYDETGTWNGRDPDPELTGVGHEQARRLADHVTCADNGAGPRDYVNRSRFGFTHLYSSLMIRALTTASYLSSALNLPLLVWEGLHEVGGIFVIDDASGEYLGQSGRSRSELAARFPKAQWPATLTENGWWNRSHETVPLQARRARRFVYDLIERHGGTDDRVAVVSHGGFYNFVLAEMLSVQADNGFWFSLNNTGITRLNFDAEGIGLAYANRVEHLPAALIT